MKSEIGVSRPVPAYGTRRAHSLIAAVSVLVATAGLAGAAEPVGPHPYSESGMLGAAHGAGARSGDPIVNIGIPPPDELRVLEARREAELKRLSDKLKRAEQRGPAPVPEFKTPAWTTDVAVAPADGIDTNQRSALGATNDQSSTEQRRRDQADGTHGHATILMVMAPRDRHSFNTEGTTDPILCVTDGCYVSNGSQAPATYHSFHDSLGLGARLSRGAGSCNHSTICVFRNIDVGAGGAMVQPIDLKFVRHDRREQSEATIDSSCRVIDGRLSCSRPVRTGSYTLWVVPESVAREIGPEALANAVSEGLRTSRTAELPWVKQ